MAILEKTEIKNFLKIDIDDDNILLEVLQSAAESYIKNAGVAEIDYNDSLCKLAVMMLIGHWYDNREAVVMGTISKTLELSLTSIIIQLRNKNRVLTT